MFSLKGRRWVWWVVGVAATVLHFGVLGYLAKRKPFWFDELFTYAIATLPTLGDMQREVSAGVDHHPPIYFFGMKLVASLFADPEVGFRVPSMFGYWLVCMGVCVFVARRSSWMYGLVGAAVAHLSGGRQWATEARPYGLAAGFAAMAFVSWQKAGEGERRRFWLIALACWIAAAISTSYYSVLILAPLGCAEVVREWRMRRVDWPMWGSLAAGAASALPYLGTVKRSVESFHPENWAKPTRGMVYQNYEALFGEMTLFFVFVLLILGASLAYQRRDGDEGSRAIESGSVKPEEIVLCLGLLVLPVLGLAVAYAFVGMMNARYVLSAIPGFCILVALFAHRFTRGGMWSGAALLGAAGVAFVLWYRMDLDRAAAARAKIEVTESLIARLGGGAHASLPVVFDDYLLSTQARHYLKGEAASRVVLLVDPEASLRYSGYAYTGRGLFRMQKFSTARLERYGDFRRRESRFLYFESGALYLKRKLIDEGATLQLLGNEKALAVYLVDAPGKPAVDSMRN